MDALLNTTEVKAYLAVKKEAHRLGKIMVKCRTPMRIDDREMTLGTVLPGMECELEQARIQHLALDKQLQDSKKAVLAMPAFQALCVEKKYEPWYGLGVLSGMFNA